MRTFLCFLVIALLGGSAAQPSPPPVPQGRVTCGQSEVGHVESADSRGLKLSVVTSCKVAKRFRFAPAWGVNLKCDVSRKEIRFERRADGSRDYVRLGSVPDQPCCSGAVQVTNKNLEQVQQVCR
jgi:hypothetical protein